MYVHLAGAFVSYLKVRGKKRHVGLLFFLFFSQDWALKNAEFTYVTYVHGETRFLRIASGSIAGSICCNGVLFFLLPERLSGLRNPVVKTESCFFFFLPWGVF